MYYGLNNFMKPVVVFFVLVIFSCSFVKEDKNRGEHPVNQNGNYVVNIAGSEVTSTSSTCINMYSYPLWCDSDKEIKKFNTEIATSMEKQNKVKNSSIIINCNHDDISQTTPCSFEQKSETDISLNDSVFVSVSDKSNSDSGVLAVFFEGANDLFFQTYYSLYNSFCLNTSTHCCFVRMGEYSVFYLSISLGNNEQVVREYIDSIKGIVIDKRYFDNDSLNGAYNTFMCNFLDRCNYTKWYYSSLIQGVNMPQKYYNENNWNISNLGKDLKKIKISKVGMKLMHRGKIDSKTIDNIKLVLKTVLTQGGTEPYKYHR